jgi:hypothetical protein
MHLAVTQVNKKPMMALWMLNSLKSKMIKNNLSL